MQTTASGKRQFALILPSTSTSPISRQSTLNYDRTQNGQPGISQINRSRQIQDQHGLKPADDTSLAAKLALRMRVTALSSFALDPCDDASGKVTRVTKITHPRAGGDTNPRLETRRRRIASWPDFSVGTLGGARFRAADAVNDALRSGARRDSRSQIIDSVRGTENHIASGRQGTMNVATGCTEYLARSGALRSPSEAQIPERKARRIAAKRWAVRPIPHAWHNARRGSP